MSVIKNIRSRKPFHLPGDRRGTPRRASTVFRGVFFYAMKHDGSTGGNSTERGKIAGGFLNAWNGGRYSGQMESNTGATAGEWQRKDGERVVFRLIEGGLLIH